MRKILFLKIIKLIISLILIILVSESLSAQLNAPNLPILDISGQKDQHVIIAEGTEEIYQGHPTTVLMPDGEIIFCVWTKGHGGRCGPMAKSINGGLNWQMIDTPDDWETTENCPSIYLLEDSTGKERLFVFAGRPEMPVTYSEDNGENWTPFTSLNMPCVMAFSSIMKLKNGDYLGLYHRGNDDRDRVPLKVWQSISKDGGLSWGTPRIAGELEGHSPCEPALVRSPDGKQLLCIMRENQRKGHSLIMTSDDEGKTWSNLKESPWGLTGDRHVAKYTDDGRLVVTFRDMAPNSPTKGHFVAWVGTYKDIIGGLSGQYRVKILHNYAGVDCGYSGLELLPDGTFVATTYIKYEPGKEMHSVVSVRFNINELDAILRD